MKVNEIFYSLQGEGRWTGTPSVFVRFSGCNLRCIFCDTDHTGSRDMTVEEILSALRSSLFSIDAKEVHVVLTGGEPGLQVTQELVDALHQEGLYIQIETNGTRQLPEGIDWITCSPKDAPVVLSHIDELKVVYNVQDLSQYNNMKATVYSLQPMDTGDENQNRLITQQTIQYCQQHPRWHLSLQTHKMLGIR